MKNALPYGVTLPLRLRALKTVFGDKGESKYVRVFSTDSKVKVAFPAGKRMQHKPRPDTGGTTSLPCNAGRPIKFKDAFAAYMLSDPSDTLVISDSGWMAYYLLLNNTSIKHVIIDGGGGQIDIAIKICQLIVRRKLIVTVLSAYSAGTYYLALKGVEVWSHPSCVYAMHGSGPSGESRQYPFGDSLHNASVAYNRMLTLTDVFDGPRSKVMLDLWTKHYLGKPEEFWRAHHPSSFWMDIPFSSLVGLKVLSDSDFEQIEKDIASFWLTEGAVTEEESTK